MREELISEYTNSARSFIKPKIVTQVIDYELLKDNFSVEFGEEKGLPKLWITSKIDTGDEKLNLYIYDLDTGLGIFMEKYGFHKGVMWIKLFTRISELTGLKIDIHYGGKVVFSDSIKYDKDFELVIEGKKVEFHAPFDDEAHHQFGEIFIHNEYNKYGCHVKEGDICLDLGANYGFFSMYANSKGASKSYAVEPVDRTFNFLQLNAECSDKIIPIHCGAGKENSRRTIYKADWHSGGSSLFEAGPDSPDVFSTEDIDVVNINDIIKKYDIEHINFLKFDVEGSEYEIFGALDEDYLTNHIDRMIGEFHNNVDGAVDAIIDKIERCGFEYREYHIKTMGYIIAWKPGEVVNEDLGVNTSRLVARDDNIVDLVCHFSGQPFVEIKGGDLNKKYNIEFIDTANGKVEYSNIITTNHWVTASRRWYTDWRVNVTSGEEKVFEHIFNLNEKHVLITFDSKSLGDNLAWIPYVEEFRKKHNCRVSVSTFWNDLFKDQYLDIDFVKPGSVLNEIYAKYTIGCWDGDSSRNKNDWREIPIQKIAADILGIKFREIKPKLHIPDKKNNGRKTACIGIHSTAQCKYWNYPSGWDKVTEYLKGEGYNVIHISKEKGNYMGNPIVKGVTDGTGNKPIEKRIKQLVNADLFVGTSSGLSWLSWAVGTPVVMISGCTAPFNEFTEGVERLHNPDVCNSCMNDEDIIFDRGQWNWCPSGKDFECTKVITPEMVISSIDRILHIGTDINE